MPINVPGSIRSVLGAKRRWFLQFVESDRDRQALLLLELWKAEIAPAISKGAFRPSFPQLLARRCSFTFPLFSPFFLRMESPAHLDAMRVVHQPVEDSAGQRGISDLFVPARHWQLRSQDHRARLVAILGDLPEVSSLRF